MIDIEEEIKTLLQTVLAHIGADYTRIEVDEGETPETYHINIISENPSILIGQHGTNIQALQHLLKVLSWKVTKKENLILILDIDNYRKRQEENAVNLAVRKAEKVRRSGYKQHLPPMSSTVRRKVHLHFMSPGFEDLETYSEGEKDRRHIVIKLKN